MQSIIDIYINKVIMKLDKNGGGWIVKNIKMKVARMEKNISQIQLAQKAGVTRQTIGMIEAGDYNPSLKLCIAICKELGKTLDDLFWEEDDL